MKKRILELYQKYIINGRLKEMIKQTKWIYSYARHYWLAMIFYTFLGLFGTIISLISGFISRDMVDIITGHQTGELIKTFSLMIGFTIGNTLVNQITSYASSWINLKVDSEIKSDIFNKILITDWESITNYHTGDLLTRWSSDATTISSGILNWLPNLIINIFRFFSAFFIVIYNDITFAIFSFISIPFSLLMSKTLMKRMVSNNKRSAAMNAKMSSFNQEAFSNIHSIKAFDAIEYYTEKLKSLQKDYIKMRLDFQKMSIGTSLIMTLVGLLVSYSSYGWGIYRVFTGAITYGTMTLFLSLSGTLTGAINNLVSMVPSAISLTTSAGRLMDILDMPQEDYSYSLDYKKNLKTFNKYGASLILDDISYTYNNGKNVFNNVNIEANPNEIIALVGPSGEGKTTMLRVLLSILKPQSGSLQIKSKDITLPLTPASRKIMSYVPQGNTMFSGTIAENMRILKEDATDEEIIEVLKMTCAWDFVSVMPDGIYSKIKEKGGGFSEGQAQRLSIARALLRKSPILFLDEATSALDISTERKVLKNIMSSNYPRTCIITTHRPTVLSMCNHVYAIKNKSCIKLNNKEVNTLIKDF